MTPEFGNFFVTLSTVPLLQSLWNVSIGNSNRILYGFSALTSVLLFTQGLWLWLHPIFIIVGMYGLLGYYWRHRFRAAG